MDKYQQFSSNTPVQSQQQAHEMPVIMSGPTTQTTVVTSTPPAVEYSPYENYSWCHYVMSLLLLIFAACCNPCTAIFSLLGVIYSSNAYGHHGNKEYGKARNLNHIAMIFWILALIFAILSTLVFIIVISVVMSAAKATTGVVQSGFVDAVNNALRTTTERPFWQG